MYNCIITYNVPVSRQLRIPTLVQMYRVSQQPLVVCNYRYCSMHTKTIISGPVLELYNCAGSNMNITISEDPVQIVQVLLVPFYNALQKGDIKLLL